ncbi:MAG: hypothetical protein K2N17_05790 [Clostridia bacterium]|nr:hypothetical protein [Clostridia bacterium]
MNKFKKAMLGLVAAAGVSCLCGAAACTAPKYYQLIFEGSGIDYVLQDRLAEFENGGTVKKGVEVRFTVSLGASTIGEPVISLSDGTTLTPDENGVYSFIMNRETKVSASGLNGIYTLTLDKFEEVLGSDGEYRREERWITYLDEKGNELGDEVRLEGGSNFKFKLDISPYYVQSCSVNCGYEVLEPDKNGVYTVEDITSDSTVRVSGLVQEDNFFFRKDCGSGTEEDPFLLSRPIDMFYLAVVVNDDYYVDLRTKHYKLATDIDMQGAQMFVIGDGSNDSAAFMGTFDGNGKTISNFFITDEVINQENYQNEYLTAVGLFGNAVPTTASPVVIKNLTLKDYEVRVHPGESQTRSFSGSLVGSGIGVQITNCHADGDIIAFGDDNQIIFTGGLAGYLQAAYVNLDSSTTVAYDSFVRSCSTNVNIEGTGSPRSAGGLVGYLVSANTNAIGYVVNSYSTGNIYGAMHAGGIVGTLGRYSSITNCYSTSIVSASNTISSALVSSDYMVAYAGGIAGFADEDSAIVSCYVANGKLSANSVHGSIYEDTGKAYDGVIGHSAEKGAIAVNSSSAVLYNNQSKRSGATAAMFTETLGWSEYDWIFTGDLPTIQPVARILYEKRELTVNVRAVWGDFQRTYSYEVSERPPIHDWYSHVLPEYETNGLGDKLSWGYYFDTALTKKVPYGFVPAVKQTTLFVDFADYGEVAGKYYVSDATYSNGAYMELDTNGNVFFRNGGLTYRSKYTYDGNEITLIDSACANLLYTMEEINGGYCTFRGVKTDEGFILSGKTMMVDVVNSTEEDQVEVIREMQLTVVRQSDNFVYGEYRANGDGSTYVFNKGGTGVFTNARKVRQSFTYTVSGSDVEIIYDGGNGGAEATLSNGKVVKVGNVDVSLKDGFAGLWRATANSDVWFEFDGFGALRYKQGGLIANSTYNPDGTFSVGGNSYTASLNENSVLEINGKQYYLDDGFTGTWYFTSGKERIEVTLDGAGRNGYGDATISYAGNQVVSLSAQYDVFTDSYGTSLRVYVQDRTYGELVLDSAGGKASGIFYSMHHSAYYEDAQFLLYDNYRGTWVGNAAQLGDIKVDTVTFDGKTVSGKAEVIITDDLGVTHRGTYTPDGVTVGGNTYSLSPDELEGTVSIANDVTLARRDEWYGVTLYEGDTTYKFDGKGYLTGTVTVSDGTELSYTVRGGVVTVGSNQLTATESGFTLGGKTLTFKSGFVGEWLVAGTDYCLNITEVAEAFKAKVTYSDPEFTGTYYFVYNPVTATLTYTQDVGGEKLVTTIGLLGGNEISIRQNSVSVYLSRNALRSSLVDEWKGTYNNPDNLTSWTFNGLGNSAYGSGKAVFKAADGTETEYYYKINAFGVPYISVDGGKTFVGSSFGDYFKDGNGYYLQDLNALYEREVTLVVPEGDNLKLIFDGVSTLYRKDGDELIAAYTYQIMRQNEVYLVDVNTNKAYIGTIKKEGVTYYLALSE